ncbi:hypothetical protein [Deinococcus multiflagellatus]|uniref:Uncharacterized protein n=1 Tax=Deinococcus multiflagellatus TaxID=1656887 RepID=A0ABW1ZK05_9DEIO
MRAMGNPQPVNRRLLGHALTHRAGWLTLGALVLGGLGWTAYREWLPPQEGARFEATNQQDISALFARPDAPRGIYQAVTLTYPRGTQAAVYATVSGSKGAGNPLGRMSRSTTSPRRRSRTSQVACPGATATRNGCC